MPARSRCNCRPRNQVRTTRILGQDGVARQHEEGVPARVKARAVRMYHETRSGHQTDCAPLVDGHGGEIVAGSVFCAPEFPSWGTLPSVDG